MLQKKAQQDSIRKIQGINILYQQRAYWSENNEIQTCIVLMSLQYSVKIFI